MVETTENISATLSFNHEQCLKVLHSQINEELNEFKNKHFNFKSLFVSFLATNKSEFIHNLMPILVCSICLFVSSYNEPTATFIPNISNGIILFIFTCFNLASILFVYFKRTSIVYNKAKFVLTLIDSKLIIFYFVKVFINFYTLKQDCLKKTKKNIDYESFDINMPYSQAIAVSYTKSKFI